MEQKIVDVTDIRNAKMVATYVSSAAWGKEDPVSGPGAPGLPLADSRSRCLDLSPSQFGRISRPSRVLRSRWQTDAMAASPLVVPPSNPIQSTLKAVPSPLRRPTSTHPSSTNGTPQASRPTGQPSSASMMDLAEQMNLEERRKYVKGALRSCPAFE